MLPQWGKNWWKFETWLLKLGSSTCKWNNMATACTAVPSRFHLATFVISLALSKPSLQACCIETGKKKKLFHYIVGVAVAMSQLAGCSAASRFPLSFSFFFSFSRMKALVLANLGWKKLILWTAPSVEHTQPKCLVLRGFSAHKTSKTCMLRPHAYFSRSSLFAAGTGAPAWLSQRCQFLLTS